MNETGAKTETYQLKFWMKLVCFFNLMPEELAHGTHAGEQGMFLSDALFIPTSFRQARKCALGGERDAGCQVSRVSFPALNLTGFKALGKSLNLCSKQG